MEKTINSKKYAKSIIDALREGDKMSRREKFNEVLHKHGYRSLNHFCIENKLSQSNYNKRVKDESIRVEIDLLFQMANMLHEPIETMIQIFYPDDWEENRKSLENK